MSGRALDERAPERGSRTGAAPVTGLVVCYNEARRLASCLRSFRICDEVLVIDLGSTDGSLDIIRDHDVQLIRHPHVPFVEQVRRVGVERARNDWVLLLDPDEELPEPLDPALRRATRQDDVGMVRAPLRFHFKGEPLTYTKWGVVDTAKVTLIHRSRVRLRPLVHRGFELEPGYREMVIPDTGDNAIRHYWIDSYRELVRKHWRYLRHEGESRWQVGDRFAVTAALRDAARTAATNLIAYRGLRHGPRGIFLSLFHGVYVLGSWLSLWRYGRREAGRG